MNLIIKIPISIIIQDGGPNMVDTEMLKVQTPVIIQKNSNYGSFRYHSFQFWYLIFIIQRYL